MDTKERQALVAGWIDHQHKLGELIEQRGDINKVTDEDTDRFGTFWAVDQLWDLNQDQPELVWEIILEILATDSSDLILANLAAGPLEDLLANHGPQFIDRVEAHAEKDPLFRHLLGGVWQNKVPDELWTRIEAARENRRW